MGATGALIMAIARRRLSLPLLKQAMNTTAKLSTFVVFILIGARVFSLTFYGVNGHVWVEHLLTSLPGGQLGFLIVVNILIFCWRFSSTSSNWRSSWCRCWGRLRKNWGSIWCGLVCCWR